MRRRQTASPPSWDGMVADAKGNLWTPEQMQQICQERIRFMESDHPFARELRRQDEEAKQS